MKLHLLLLISLIFTLYIHSILIKEEQLQRVKFQYLDLQLVYQAHNYNLLRKVNKEIALQELGSNEWQPFSLSIEGGRYYGLCNYSDRLHLGLFTNPSLLTDILIRLYTPFLHTSEITPFKKEIFSLFYQEKKKGYYTSKGYIHQGICYTAPPLKSLIYDSDTKEKLNIYQAPKALLKALFDDKFPHIEAVLNTRVQEFEGIRGSGYSNAVKKDIERYITNPELLSLIDYRKNSSQAHKNRYILIENSENKSFAIFLDYL